jgi:hypothetical protein
MAVRKMTFSLPEELVVQFLRRVSPRDRSRYVATALAEKLAERERQLIRACEVANQNPEVLAIEKELGALPGEISEPWTDAGTR